MPIFCSPISSRTSIANIGAIKYQNISGKRNIKAQRSIRTARCFFNSVSNDFLRISTSQVIRTAISSNSKQLETPFCLENRHKGCSFLFRTEFHGLVKVVVGVRDMKHTILIEVQSLPQSMIDHKLILLWGTFQGNFRPEASQHFRKTPFLRDSSSNHMVCINLDDRNIPFYFSFLLQIDGDVTESRIGTHRRTNFCVPVGLGVGYPMPMGISHHNDGSANFSLSSRNAKSLVLCLYDSKGSEPSLELELDPYVNRTGDIWHALIHDISNYTYYGYRCCDRNSTHPHRVLLDPYAKMIKKNSCDQGESLCMTNFLGVLCKERNFDWSGDIRPRIPMEKLVVYRLNVEQFTKNKCSGLVENVAGTFGGVIEKIRHFIDLGVNAVLLEPVFSFDEKKGPYFPYHLFSPMNRYGDMADSLSSANSMKEMVKALHVHGIEVLLEVVFTHIYDAGNAETQSEPYSALKCNDPNVQQLILDSLHYWVTEFHIDGFCFINSSSFLHDSSLRHHLPRPPLIEAIAFDPLLSESKIISDCWSQFDMSFKDAVFPHWKRWAMMNSKYLHDVRKFLTGDGLLSHFATRLCGSGDVFAPSMGPSFSFNFITKNAGLSLVDLVSFSGPALASEFSWNCGVEGPTNKTSVLEIRLRQVRNFIFVLFISLGVPVINMGDELGYSNGGSPSYNDRTPIAWRDLRTQFSIQITNFIAFLTSLRNRRSDIFQRRSFYRIENVTWHGRDQSPPNWDDPSSSFLAMKLKSDDSNSYNGDLFIAINAGELSELVTLPELSEDFIWFRLVDTSLPSTNFFSNSFDTTMGRDNEELVSYEVKPHACALFEAKGLNS